MARQDIVDRVIRPRGGNQTTLELVPAYAFAFDAGQLVATVTQSLIYTLDGAGVAITTGTKGFIGPLGFAATINGWTLTSDVSTTTTMDIWKDTLANHPPTNADSIVASAKPTLTAAVQNSSTTLTGWTTSIGATDILRFEVEANNNATYLALQLAISRSL